MNELIVPDKADYGANWRKAEMWSKRSNAEPHYEAFPAGTSGVFQAVTGTLSIPSQSTPYLLRFFAAVQLTLTTAGDVFSMVMLDGGPASATCPISSPTADSSGDWVTSAAPATYEPVAKVYGVIVVSDGNQRTIGTLVNQVSGSGTFSTSGPVGGPNPYNRIDAFVTALFS